MQYHQRASHRPQQRKKPVYASPDPDELETASPQYTGHYAGLHGEDQPSITAADVQKRMKRPAYEQDEMQAGQQITHVVMRYSGTPKQMPDGMIYRQGNEQVYVHNGPPPVPQRASKGKNTTAQYQIPQQAASFQEGQPRRRLHWLFFVGLALMVMIIGYVGLNAFGAWWQIHNDDSIYGRPRTFQIDAVVGHGDSEAHPSHFIAINLNRHVIVIEIPGGDVSRSIIYSGPVLLGDRQDLTPVTLTFADINGDGKPDMLLHILDQTIAFLNNGTKFVPPPNLVNGGSNPPIPGGTHAGEDTHTARLS